MGKFESIFLGIFIGIIVMLFTFCLGWWVGFGIYKTFILSETIIKAGMVLGIIAGIIINIRYLKKWINNSYHLDNYIWITVYLVLSIGTIGFFMGVPIFNIFPGILAGIFIGRKSRYVKASEEKFKMSLKNINKLNMITLTIICIFSATLALMDSYTAANLQGMLNIKAFQITKFHIVGIILLGGIGLISIQHFLTCKIAIIAYKAN